MSINTFNLFSEVKPYLKLKEKLETYLSKFPNDWIKFQDDFNLSLNKLYKDILQFERENIKEDEAKVYRLKKIFEKRYRHHFLYGEFIKWSYKKPYGYAGDFKIIDAIYQNNPSTNGFDRLWDNYFQLLAAPQAIRERKSDFKRIIFDFIKERRSQKTRIMNLASGPAREIKELLETNGDYVLPSVIFDCYDFDANAIEYAKRLLANTKNVNFFQKNAIRLALKDNIEKEITQKYDFIYSTGLFDYLDARIAIRLVSNLRKLLKNGGLMAIASAREKYNNPSASWMEWVADWSLIYRTETEFRNIFLGSDFSEKNIKIVPQKITKVMQYCFTIST